MLTQRLVEGWTLCAGGPDEVGTETWSQRRPAGAQAAPVPGIIQNRRRRNEYAGNSVR